MENTVEKIIKLFEEGVKFLSEHNVKWAGYLKELKYKLEKCDSRSELLLFLNNNEKNIFGGMGSLLDVFISEKNGHIARNFKESNKKLDDYRKRFYSEWKLVKRELAERKQE